MDTVPTWENLENFQLESNRLLMALRKLEFICKKAQRLDAGISLAMPALSKRAWKELIKDGKITVNGKKVIKHGFTIQKNAIVSVELQLPQLKPATNELQVLYSDSFLVAVDKPRGLPVLPQNVTDTDTLLYRMAKRFPQVQNAFFAVNFTFNPEAPFQPKDQKAVEKICREISQRLNEGGALHRLDTTTSGVVLFALEPEIKAKMEHLFETHQIVKRYLALTVSRAQLGTIISPIINLKGSADRVKVAGVKTLDTIPESNKAKLELIEKSKEKIAELKLKERLQPAVTIVASSEEFGSLFATEIEIVTGCRHQIRAHLASVGAPIVGDRLYMPGSEKHSVAEYPLLHAKELEFVHPVRGTKVSIFAKLPADIKSILTSQIIRSD